MIFNNSKGFVMALIKIYTARDSLEAHFLRSLLEQAEIKAAVMGEMLSIARGDLPATQETLPSVWIHDDDADRVRPILTDYLRSPGNDADTPAGEWWTCPACSETIEGQFDACWHCGQTRDGQGAHD